MKSRSLSRRLITASYSTTPLRDAKQPISRAVRAHASWALRLAHEAAARIATRVLCSISGELRQSDSGLRGPVLSQRLSRDIARVPEVAGKVEGVALLDPARQQEEENRHDGAGQ